MQFYLYRQFLLENRESRELNEIADISEIILARPFLTIGDLKLSSACASCAPPLFWERHACRRCSTSGADRSLCIYFFVANDNDGNDEGGRDRIDVIAWLTARLKWPIGCQETRCCRCTHNVRTYVHICIEEGRILRVELPDIRTHTHARTHFLADVLRSAAAAESEWHWPCQSALAR